MLNNSINKNPQSYEEVLDPNSKLAINITLTEQPNQQSTIENEDELGNTTNDKCLPDCCYDQEGKLDVPSGICMSCTIAIGVPFFFILCIATCGFCASICDER